MTEYQQFVIRVVDERGDPVPDYNIQIFTRSAEQGAGDPPVRRGCSHLQR